MVYPYFYGVFTPYPIDTKKENDMMEVVPAKIVKNLNLKRLFCFKLTVTQVGTQDAK
jgi:hypothetical protein